MSKNKKIDKSQNQKLEQKLKTDSNFKNQMTKAKIITEQLLQRSLYSNLDCINKNLFIKFFQDEDQVIYFYFAMLHPGKDYNSKNTTSNSQNKILQKLSMFLLKKLQIMKKFYTIVFFNQLADSNAYNQLRNIFMCLPFEYFFNLNHFILVQPSFYHKATNSMFSFNILNKFIKIKSINVQNSKELSQKINFPLDEIIKYLPQEIVLQEFPQIIYKQKKKDKENNQKSQNKQISPNVFKDILVPNQSSKLEKKQLNQYALSQFGIPIYFQNIILYLQTSQNGLSQEGIFRKSVSIDQENEALMQLNNNNFDYLMQIKNPHIVANILKRFLSNLKSPIIPYDSYSIMMHDQGIENKVKFYKQIIQNIPNVNYQTLAYLIRFLKYDVIPKQKMNKMPQKNIAICFTPCLMRFQTPSIADMIFATKASTAMEIILNKYEQIFDLKKQQQIAHNSFIETKKSFVRESLNLNLNSGFFRNSIGFQQGQNMFKQPIISQKIQSQPNMTKSKSVSETYLIKQEDYMVEDDHLREHCSANVNQTLKAKKSYKSQQNQLIEQKNCKDQKIIEIKKSYQDLNQKQAQQSLLLKKSSKINDQEQFQRKITQDLKQQSIDMTKQMKNVTRSRLACRVNTIQTDQIYKSSLRFKNQVQQQRRTQNNDKDLILHQSYKQKLCNTQQVQIQQYDEIEQVEIKNSEKQTQQMQKNLEWLMQLQQGKQIQNSFIRVSYLDQDYSDKFQILNIDEIDEKEKIN